MRKLISVYLILACVWAGSYAQQDSTIIHLWPNGAPGFESRRNEPEKGDKYISNVHNPSITVYLPPKGKANGAAVLICPGGGHRILVFRAEGTEPAHYLNGLGVAAIVLKYRLARDTNSPYDLEIHARQDGLRAMRIIRANAAKWGIDPNRIGMMGFSAGGEVVDQVAFGTSQETSTAMKILHDPLENVSAKPNFLIQVYPGPLDVPTAIPHDAPPAFLVAANDDLCCSPPIVKLLQAYRQAGVQVETHLYAQGKHGFNMGMRSKLASLKAWPQRLSEWLEDNHYFASNQAAK